MGLAFGLAVLVSGCVTTGSAAPAALATAALVRADGATVGTASLRRDRGGTLLQVSVSGLTPGTHGIHLHAIGTCAAPGFASAGGHLNPSGHQHGTLNPAGSHLGDLPNLEVRADGTASLTFRIGQAPSLLRGPLFDADGTALVIHAGPDDYRTDPSGNSGARIACGVLTAGQP
jgi:Cu-Zn family superoxide dismutase